MPMATRRAPHWPMTAMAVVSSIGLGASVVWGITHERPATAPARQFVAFNLPPPPDPVSLAGALFAGDERAPVLLLQFSEFQCPYCALFANTTLPVLRERYIRPGKVRMAFRHFPLESIHSLAVKAAESSECAHQVGKFWDMHDALFASPDRLTPASFGQTARRLGLDGGNFDACLDGRMTAKVKQDKQLGVDLGVSGTPTFFLGRVLPDGQLAVARRLSGALPAEVFAEEIDRLMTTTDAPSTEQQD
jgi:protein-disulfide isomerase